MANALFLFWSSHQYIDYTSIRHVIHSFSLQSTHTSLTFRMMCLVVLCTQKVTIIDGSLTPPSSLSPSSCIHLLTYSVQLNYVCITKAIYLAWANEHWQYAFIIIIHWPHRTTHAQILMVYCVLGEIVSCPCPQHKNQNAWESRSINLVAEATIVDDMVLKIEWNNI